jgi:plasmid stabilization system protein ParE
MVVFGHYLIFYTVHTETVRIQRILHSARDIRYLFDAWW